MLELGRLQRDNEALRRQLETYKEALNHRTRMWKSARSAAMTWEGKFHQVKRENNALRRKLYQQKIVKE